MADNNKLQDTLKSWGESSTPLIPEEVTSWLGRLVLLYGVPFHYLLPEEEMLPPDPGSLRFFFLDPIWIQCLVQGACSVGSNGYGDRLIDAAMNEWVQPNQPKGKDQRGLANQKAAGVRDRLRQQYEAVPLPPEDAHLDWPLTGFLLRSAVVDGWRGLEVMAYRELNESELSDLPAKLSNQARTILEKAKGNITAAARAGLRNQLRDILRDRTLEQKQEIFRRAGVQTQEAFLKLLVELVKPLKLLRIEQISKDVMLGIFNGIIAQLVIRQPQEGLHFGLTAEHQSYTKTMRELGYKTPANAGEILQGKKIDLANANLVRDQEHKGVIKIASLAKAIKDLLGNDELKDGKFTSAEFAVEMIEAAGEFTYLPRITTLS